MEKINPSQFIYIIQQSSGCYANDEAKKNQSPLNEIEVETIGNWLIQSTKSIKNHPFETSCDKPMKHRVFTSSKFYLYIN